MIGVFFSKGLFLLINTNIKNYNEIKETHWKKETVTMCVYFAFKLGRYRHWKTRSSHLNLWLYFPLFRFVGRKAGFIRYTFPSGWRHHHHRSSYSFYVALLQTTRAHYLHTTERGKWGITRIQLWTNWQFLDLTIFFSLNTVSIIRSWNK